MIEIRFIIYIFIYDKIAKEANNRIDRIQDLVSEISSRRSIGVGSSYVSGFFKFMHNC